MDEHAAEQLARDIAKLYTLVESRNGELRELRVSIIGIDGGNGLRGEMRDFIVRQELSNKEMRGEYLPRLDALEAEVQDAVAWGNDMYNVKRYMPGECIGETALLKHIADAEKDKKTAIENMIELRKTRYAMIGALLVALITTGGSVIVALMQIPKGVIPLTL